MHSEEEAKTKWCFFRARIFCMDSLQNMHATCVASECAMWRLNYDYGIKTGYCGLASYSDTEDKRNIMNERRNEHETR